VSGISPIDVINRNFFLSLRKIDCVGGIGFLKKKRDSGFVCSITLLLPITFICSSLTGEDVIPQSLQQIAGRTAQEYNIRKKRKGADYNRGGDE
jgi:hypothetical protein